MKSNDYVFIGGVTLVIFIATYTLLALLGFVPEQFKFVSIKPPVTQNQVDNSSDVDTVDKNLVPSKIEIPKIGVSSIIGTPQNVDVASLDAALTKGAVYYPGSGTLQGGNMFLFGHSTNWKVVNNAAYKTFNDLDKLQAGDEIFLTSGTKKYVYIVQNIKLASENDAFVDFASNGRMLTISTCDTFGRKQDRWVVEAEFKEVR